MSTPSADEPPPPDSRCSSTTAVSPVIEVGARHRHEIARVQQQPFEVDLDVTRVGPGDLQDVGLVRVRQRLAQLGHLAHVDQAEQVIVDRQHLGRVVQERRHRVLLGERARHHDRRPAQRDRPGRRREDELAALAIGPALPGSWIPHACRHGRPLS
jgi:hypothetical protein